MPERESTEGPHPIRRAGALGAVLVGAALLVAACAVAEVRAVGSASMAPTIVAGERVLVTKAGFDRLALPPGTLVVFDAQDLWAAPDDPAGTVFVKRVVGVGGDRIACCAPDGRLLRNGTPLDESYLGGQASDQQAFDVTVRPGHYWLLGDNRGFSADARAHLGDPGGGHVPASRIIGRVEFVVWPFDHIRRLEVRG